MQNMSKVILKKTKTNKLIYIPRAEEFEITLEKIWDLEKTVKIYGPVEMEERKFSLRSSMARVSSQYDSFRLQQPQDTKQFIQVWVLSQSDLVELWSSPDYDHDLPAQTTCFCFGSNQQPRHLGPLEFDAILVHIHGGGFVSMQSGSH